MIAPSTARCQLETPLVPMLATANARAPTATPAPGGTSVAMSFSRRYQSDEVQMNRTPAIQPMTGTTSPPTQ